MFKFGLNRFAAIVVRAAYLVALYTGIYLFCLHHGIANAPAGEVLSIVAPTAIVLHEFLQQQSVLSFFRQLMRNPGSKPIKYQLGFHGAVLFALTCFDGYCVWQLNPAFLVFPFLFFTSSVLVEADEDAPGILARNAMGMLLKTTRQTSRQWKKRIKTATKQGLNLAPIAAALMQDAGNVDDARRVRMIDQELTRAEGQKPHGALSHRNQKSRQLYSSSAQATPAATDGSFPGGISLDVTGSRMPRRLSKKSVKERIFSLLTKADDPFAITVAELARKADCDEKTARKYRQEWMKLSSISLAAG